MSDEFDHLFPAVRPIAALGAEERVRRIRADRWIDYPLAREALAKLEELIAFPPRARMPNLLIVGASGMGKTMIVEKFARDHPGYYDAANELKRIPVVVVQMVSGPDEARFYKRLLAAIGAPEPPRPTLGLLESAALRLLGETKPGMLVIDEVHSLQAGTVREQARFLNMLRFLGNELRIPLVCVGTQAARNALRADDQLVRRFEAFALPPWRNDDDFAGLIGSLMRSLPLRRESVFGDLRPSAARRGDRRRHRPDFRRRRPARRRCDRERRGADRRRRDRRQTGRFGADRRAGLTELALARLLPVAPRPETDERLSSWLARIAALYGMPVGALLAHCGLVRADPFALEKGLGVGEGTLLAERTGLSPEAIEAMTFCELAAPAHGMIARGERGICPLCANNPAIRRRDAALPWGFWCAVHGLRRRPLAGEAIETLFGAAALVELDPLARRGARRLPIGPPGRDDADPVGSRSPGAYWPRRYRRPSPPQLHEQPRLSLEARRAYRGFLEFPIARQALLVVVPEYDRIAPPLAKPVRAGLQGLA